MVLQDFDQGIQSAQLAIDLELQIYDDGVQNINVQESLLFIAEAYQYSEKYVKSNEKLSILL
jgi:hypothetical protein